MTSQSTESTERRKIGHASTLRHRDEKMALFVKALSGQGNISAACQAAGIDRRTAYNWREIYPDFEAAWNSAFDVCLDGLEEALIKRGKTQSDRAAFGMLKAHRREVYGDKVDVTSGGKPIDLSWPEANKVDPEANKELDEEAKEKSKG